MLTVKEAALYCGLAEKTIRNWMSSRKLAYYKVGRNTRIRLSDLEKKITYVPEIESPINLFKGVDND
jgi:excisionase family DNA binding protein